MNSGTTSFYGIVFQAEDMDLTNTNFTPIGTEEHPFEGIFEGPSEADKAEIKLSITRDDLDYAGLFGVLGENAEVRNLSVSGTIDNTKINQDTTNDLPTPSSGLITGLMTGDSIIENCVTDAESSVKGQRAGGLVGRIEGGSIINCINYASVFDIDGEDEGGPGGITGAAAHDANSTEYPKIIISGCENYGSVETYNTYNVGGIAGTLRNADSDTEKVIIRDSHNYGTIKGKTLVGGITGSVQNAVIEDSTNEGTITVEQRGTSQIGGIAGNATKGSLIINTKNIANINAGNSGIVGGIVGSVTTGSTIKDSVNENDITGRNSVGGIAGEVKEGRIENTQNSGKITGTSDSLDYYGGIAGRLDNSTVIKATNEGEVTGRSNVGGIAGNANGGEITDSENNAAISAFDTATYAPVGGIVGTATGNLKIKNTNNSGEVKAVRYAGGIIGQNKGTISLYEVESTGSATGQYSAGVISIIFNNPDATAYAYLENVESMKTDNSKYSYFNNVGNNSPNSTLKNCYVIEGNEKILIDNENKTRLNIAPPNSMEAITISNDV